MTNKQLFIIAIAIGLSLIVGVVTSALVSVKKEREEKAEKINTEEILSKASMKNEFVGGCMDGNAENYESCGCMFEELYKDLGKEKFLKESVDYAVTGILSDTILAAVYKVQNNCGI